MLRESNGLWRVRIVTQYIVIQFMGKNIDYPLKSYRLSEETIKNLEKIKKEKGISYNMLFVKLLNKWKN